MLILLESCFPLRDVEDRKKVDSTYKEYFGVNFPAITLVGVNKLFLDDLLVRIDANVGIPEEIEY